MLNLVCYENRPALRAPQFGLELLKHTWLGPHPPSEEECTLAMVQLCRRGLTAIINTSLLKQIKQHLSCLDGFGPTWGLPLDGELDYTLNGAEIFRAILNSECTCGSRDHYWYHTTAFVYRRNAIKLIGYDLSSIIDEAKCCEFVPVAPHEQIGVWRSQWWREIPSGY